MQMQTVSDNDDPESAGRRDTWKRCCSHVFKQILRSLSLSYDGSGDGWKNFAFSPWSSSKCGHWIYLVYRWLLVLYFYCWLLYGGIQGGGPRFFIYLTNWSYLAWCSYLLSSAISTSIGVIRAKWYDTLTERETLLGGNGVLHSNWGATDPEKLLATEGTETEQRHTSGIIVKLQWLIHKVHWVLFYLGINFALFVTTLFWVVVYGISHDITKNQLSASTYHYHGVNALFALIDIFVTGLSMNILHVVYPLLFGTAYAVFSVIYYSAHGTDGLGNHYVYSALDWSRPGKAFGFVLLSVVVEVVMYAVIYGLYRLRVWIRSRVQSNT